VIEGVASVVSGVGGGIVVVMVSPIVACDAGPGAGVSGSAELTVLNAMPRRSRRSQWPKPA
jgi:hypothetical protein